MSLINCVSLGMGLCVLVLTSSCASNSSVKHADRPAFDQETGSVIFLPSEINWIALKINASCRVQSYTRPYGFQQEIYSWSSDHTNDDTIGIIAAWHVPDDIDTNLLSRMDHEIFVAVLDAYEMARKEIWNAKTEFVRNNSYVEVHLSGKPLQITAFFRDRVDILRAHRVKVYIDPDEQVLPVAVSPAARGPEGSLIKE